MRHNKIIGWERFLGWVEQVQRVSPWLSRQMVRRAADWPFWYSGLEVRDWRERRVWVRLPLSLRTSVEREICQGHLVLGAELTLRLLLLRLHQEFPFRYRITATRLDLHHVVDQAVDFKFEIPFAEWERIRLGLAREARTEAELVFSAALADGRLAATLVFTVAFELEKFLPA